MALFELNTYGNDDEILNTFATDKVRWGVFLQALELQEELKDESPTAQFVSLSAFIKKLFPTMTDSDLENADVGDVMNVFNQLIRQANRIGGNSKNGEGAAQ